MPVTYLVPKQQEYGSSIGIGLRLFEGGRSCGETSVLSQTEQNPNYKRLVVLKSIILLHLCGRVLTKLYIIFIINNEEAPGERLVI